MCVSVSLRLCAISHRSSASSHKAFSIRRRSAERRPRWRAFKICLEMLYHPSSYMKLPIFKALGNLTVYIPSPLSSRWIFGLRRPRHHGASAAPLGRILRETHSLTSTLHIYQNSIFFGGVQARQHGPQNSSRSSKKTVFSKFLHRNAILDRVGLNFGVFWG